MVILIVPVIVAAIAAPPATVLVVSLATDIVYFLGEQEKENFKFIWKHFRKFTKDKLFDSEKITVDMKEMKEEVELLFATLEMISHDLYNVNAM
ncbi:hypothetical protein ZOSMA_184G00050 [Zostera marina]|uniref:Uncharacterized protein n=1 Tax=Zostera marina TaxID=29655 RepID=A0A0K9PQM8_ZOSMR|nr:hypothetical protein ZOSMA_184G00050 [Zostera marina]